jgi:hypothetical protein
MDVADALRQLDEAASKLVSTYRDVDRACAVIRTDGKQVRIICPGGMDGAIAKLLYAAADEMAFRSAPSKGVTKQ